MRQHGITGGQEEVTGGGGGVGFLTPSLPQPPTLGQVSTLHLPHYYVAHPTGGEN